MSLSMDDFTELKKIVKRYAENFISSQNLPYELPILAIFLYGGAAKYHVGKKEGYNDFDLNVFFKSTSPSDRSISTYGKPKIIRGGYNGKKVEVMRNVYRGSAHYALNAVKDFAKSSQSKRWRRIESEPVIFLYPSLKVLDNLL